jgi:hypothetical protein
MMNDKLKKSGNSPFIILRQFGKYHRILRQAQDDPRYMGHGEPVEP